MVQKIAASFSRLFLPVSYYKNSIFKKKLQKSLSVPKIVVPLHRNWDEVLF